jgi:hypothetical protein
VGLGLSLVAAVARLHCGKLELGDNHPGLQARVILIHEASPGARRAPAVAAVRSRPPAAGTAAGFGALRSVLLRRIAAWR